MDTYKKNNWFSLIEGNISYYFYGKGYYHFYLN
jgi:hypothetical protein